MEMAPEAKKAHAKYSASGAARWLSCSGSVGLSETAPPGFESEYAKEGTDAHSCLEVYLKNGQGKARSSTGILEAKFPKEMVKHAREAAEYVWRITPKGADLHAEFKSDISPLVGAEAWGTADIVIAEHFGRLSVWDFKYGAGIPVSPEANPQLVFYALGVAHALDYTFEDVSLGIIQPRAEHVRGPIREWVISMDELRSWADVFRQGVERAEDPLAELRAGDWCRFCPAKATCPAISTRALAQAQADFGETVAELVEQDLALTVVNDMGAALKACDQLEDWIAAVRDRATKMLEAGEPIRGFKLVNKRGTRQWTDYEKTEKAAKRKWGPLAFESPTLLSPAQLEKATGDKDWVAERVSVVVSGVTIAPESDARPAVVPAHADFELAPEDLKLPEAEPKATAKPDLLRVGRKGAKKKRKKKG